MQVSGEKHDWWGVNDRKWRLLVEQLVKTEPALSEISDEIKHFERHLDRAAVEWIVTMLEGIRLMQASSDYIHLVRFEDLTLDPGKTLAALCEFCELPTDNTFREYARQTLHPVPARKPFDVHPEIASVFHDTMAKLGYNA